jgi:hypothetical protein
MELVFFNFNKSKEPSQQKYIDIISNDKPIYEDYYNYYGLGVDDNEYKLKRTLVKPSVEGGFILKKDRPPLQFGVWGKIKRDKLLDPDTPHTIREKLLDPDTTQTIELLTTLGIWPFQTIKKKNEQRPIWDVRNDISDPYGEYYSVLIDTSTPNDQVVGRCIAGSPADTEPEYKEHDTILSQYKNCVYISRVDIHPDHRQKGHCLELVKFMILNLFSTLGDNTIVFIENGSWIHHGIPACKCYVRATNSTKLEVFYHDEDRPLQPMDETKCTESDDIPTTYFYQNKSKVGGGKSKRNKKKKHNRTRKNVKKHKKTRNRVNKHKKHKKHNRTRKLRK